MEVVIARNTFQKVGELELGALTTKMLKGWVEIVTSFKGGINSRSYNFELFKIIWSYWIVQFGGGNTIHFVFLAASLKALHNKITLPKYNRVNGTFTIVIWLKF